MAWHIFVALKIYPSTVPLSYQSTEPLPCPLGGLEPEGFSHPCNELRELEGYIGGRRPPTGCGKTNSAQQNFDRLHVWDNPGLSGYSVCSVLLFSLIQPNKPDRPNRPNELDRLAAFFSILLETQRAGEAHSHSRPQCRSHRSLLIRLRGIAQVWFHALEALGEQCLCFSIVHSRSDDAILPVLPVSRRGDFELRGQLKRIDDSKKFIKIPTTWLDRSRLA